MDAAAGLRGLLRGDCGMGMREIILVDVVLLDKKKLHIQRDFLNE